MSSAVTRRAFAGSVPLLVGTLLRCSHAILDQTRVAEAFLVDPSWTQYQPILRALITAVIPFDDSRFPKIAPQAVEEQLLRMFPLDRDAQLNALKRALIIFDQIDLFPIIAGPLLVEEAKARDLAERGGDIQSIGAAIRAADQAAFDRFKPVSDRFQRLGLNEQRAYLTLWRDSASIVKRQFYGSMRSIIIIATYSMDATWPAIGYAGPLLPRSRRT